MAELPKVGAASAAPVKPVAQPGEVKEKKAPKQIAVVATEKGYFDNSRKNPGDKFFIHDEKQFSEKWMEKI